VAAEELLLATTRRLLAMPSTRKGRYSPLASCVGQLGARRVLGLHPALVADVLEAMQDDMVANSAASFLRALLRKLREEAARTPAGAGAGRGRHWGALCCLPTCGTSAGAGPALPASLQCICMLFVIRLRRTD
jgi:hypothetical protein